MLIKINYEENKFSSFSFQQLHLLALLAFFIPNMLLFAIHTKDKSMAT